MDQSLYTKNTKGIKGNNCVWQERCKITPKAGRLLDFTGGATFRKQNGHVVFLVMKLKFQT